MMASGDGKLLALQWAEVAPIMIELFGTRDCPRCARLAEYLSNAGVEFTKRVIDEDPEAGTDALMLGIFSAPALRNGGAVLKTKDLFDGNRILEGNIKSFMES